MDDSAFDPYRQWLGVDGDAGPPNHYRLLGLEPLEDDQAKIRRVSKARYLSIKLLEPDHHRSEWKQLLSAMREAGKCLTDPEKKAAYDRDLAREALRNQTASAPPSATLVHRADGAAPPTAVPLASPRATSSLSARVSSSSPSDQPARRHSETTASDEPLKQANDLGFKPKTTSVAAEQRQRRKKALRSALPTVIVLLLIAGICWALRDRIQELLANGSGGAERPAPTKVPPPTSNPPVSAPRERPADAPPDPFANIMSDQQDTTTPTGEGGDPSNKSHTNDDSPVDDPDASNDAPPLRNSETDSSPTGDVPTGSEPTGDQPADNSSPTPVADDAQPTAPPTPEQKLPPAVTLDQLLSDAFLAMRNRQFDAAHSHLDQARQLSLAEPGRQRLATMQALSQAVDQFWKAVRSSMTQLRSGQEFEVGQTKVLVVESKPERIVIRFLGENRRYTIDDLPAGLAVAVAKQLLKKDTADTRTILGAFRLVDRPGDPEAARRLWNQAAASGADVKDLLPLLDFQPREPRTATD